jgi:flagellar biosynthetic protein FlhB
MADDEGEEKTQEPSAKRQEDAIEQGQVLTSRDLMVLVVLATGGMQLMMNGKYYFDELVGIFRQDLLFSEPIMRDLPLQTALRNAFSGVLIPFLMFAFPISIMLIATQYFFGGLHFVIGNAAPKFEKLDPISGMSKIFGMNSVMEALKSLLKIGLIGAAGVWYIVDQIPIIVQMNVISFEQSLIATGALVIKTFMILVAVWEHI